MLDIKYIKDNLNKVKEAAKNKNISIDIDLLLEIDEKRRKFQTDADTLRAERNELAKSAGKERPSEEQIKKGKEIKERILELENALSDITIKYEELMVKVPTITSEDTPIGKDDSENVEIFKWGEPTKFDFTPKSHVEIAQDLDLFDLERGAKIAGYRGYYVKNEAVSLQMALMMYALEKLIGKGFSPMIPPTLVREFALFGSGYFSGRKYNPEVDEIYKIANEEVEADGNKNKEDKFLIGTAEPSLLAYYANEILDEKQLPIKFCGFSQCYRSEIGSYGKDTKGLYRVHEFMKVEQVCICSADIEESNRLHMEMVEISKEIHQELGLPYRVLQICTGDMSAGKYKMFDLEAWMPSRNGYGETGSASNFLDWQSRRLNVKYKTKDGENKFVYMLNDTALPSIRPMIAILENFQQADGSVIIPEVLRKFMPNNISVIKRLK
ncbi:MAG: Serine-tRNA ligase [Candidatus Falkowbacteria bacterium GW2011_GWC2_38_22]|uniref:Serine--tRNA ligase n=1 Tax=Candidatus Falkowbacteria bacterium GW2011_GWE1_38_31 TaxID=1618638 RepID=A0A0G0JTZ4_9BACT|nr:MAG: Serine-tRNA ligase [Candidatus Falkowbacteria bacterium GW2011_GWF2_38_1205]KKQ62128.1 MAG: Serine-tRNA ligase [Candidatus Falkowbacteria bacterium GW2011_GWC2_38_22]KKQ64278.1 MAG: Serine-tRNA ligase [Candidatus Falkowbacteria bacterium GW2011_GWF1_38_22]KKQ66255.1 MAG: Serine-tRNA ligase [Candidatus Falkowbacteria bacterium GW2011_GWE2_38_254]KKQ70983.1 MAG: Serine-tRNA ligase [Candidatus Falkowbacteria bacterium GW2011_GWE1_38_31]KKQ73492.1 MAG: Serine-tRNA ligase [Candidatus Falkow